MDIIRFAIQNPVKIAVGVFLLVMFGILSLFSVRIQLMPDVDRPVITVRTEWIGASPQEIESEIVDRQEDKLKNVTGLSKMTATCSQNQAEILLEFPVGTDKDVAYRDVSDKLRQVTGYPEEVEEPVLSATDADMEQTIAWMILYSKQGEDVAPLKTFLEENVKPILERAEGISEVAVYGGRDREVQIEIDAHRLAARGLTFRDVERALRGQNKNISAGTIARGKLDTSFRTVGEFRSTQEVADTVIAYDAGGPVLVGDVGRVIDGFKKPYSFVRSMGQDVIAMPARRMTGANVIKAMENLKTQIAVANKEVLAPRGLGLELTQVYDETTYIWSSIDLVVSDLYVGSALAILVLILFLRSASAVGIISLAIPVSVIGSLLVLWLLDRGLNVILLAGMAFAVGMVVDDAIVVLENIYRHRSMGKSKAQAAHDGAKEVWGAVLAGTLTKMAVFLPVITIQEEAGQLFKDIAIAVSTAVGLSLLVSVFVIPPLASRYFGASKALSEGDKPWWFGSWVATMVQAVNLRVSRRIAVVTGLSGAAIIGSWLLLPASEYLPSGNRNLVFGFLFSPPGYSIDEFRRMATIVEEGDVDDPNDGLRPAWEAEIGSTQADSLPPLDIQLGRRKDVTRTIVPPPMRNFFFVSFDGGAFMGCTSKVDTVVRPLEDVMLRAASHVPGIFAMFNQSSLFQSGGRRGGNTIDIEIRGDDLTEVTAAASAIRAKLAELGFGWPAATPPNFDLGRPEVRMETDRSKAADLGLDVRDVGFIVRACVDGAFVGEYNDHGNKIDMVLTVTGTKDATMEDVGAIPIHAPSGNVVPLASAIRFTRTTSPQQITHIEEMSAVALSIKPKTGIPLEETMEELQSNVIAPLRASGAIPSTIITALAGTADKLTQTKRALIGDFRGLVQHPRLFGASVAVSIGLIVLIVIGLVALSRMLLGARAAVIAAGVAAVVLPLGFLAANPQFTLMAFESRTLLSLLVTYLLMAALFESFVYSFVILLSVPTAAVGGIVALRIVHEVSLYDVAAPIQQLDVLTMLGFILLIGIVVNNAILIVHQALNFMRHEGMDNRAAVVKSVATRTRPILMTAGTTVFGLIPLVVMPGAGSELYRGLGAVVLGGLLVSTVFTLVVVPAMFTLFLDFQAWLAGLSGAKEKEFASATAPAPTAS